MRGRFCKCRPRRTFDTEALSKIEKTDIYAPGTAIMTYSMPTFSLKMARKETKPRTCMAATDDTKGHHVRQRWAAAIAQDHRILRQLLQAFSSAQSKERETELLRLALDFHAMHQEYERAWVDAPQQKRLHRVIYDLALQLEGSQPGTSLYRARGQYWAELVTEAMHKEEKLNSNRLSISYESEPWTQELLRVRRDLMCRVSDTLNQAN